MSNEQLLPEASNPSDFGLEPQERHLIALLVAGYTSEESTERLSISERDLRDRLLKIYDKLKVSNHLELVLFALYHQVTGTVSVPPPNSQGTDH